MGTLQLVVLPSPAIVKEGSDNKGYKNEEGDDNR
jgi:hypothetical protein